MTGALPRLTGLRSRLRGRGPVELARLAVKNIVHLVRSLTPAARAARARDRAFDRRWGTDTGGEVSVHDLGLDAKALPGAKRYAALDEAMLREPIAALALDPAMFEFIDYGAGKGRAVMVAMDMGFRRATGVELSERLVGIAERNLRLFARRNPAAAPGRVLRGDAVAFRPEGRAILAFFYNPFDAAVMLRVRGRLEEALGEGTERIVVVYANPEHVDVFADAPGWTRGPESGGWTSFSAESAAFRR
ncbi:hypothetical protein [Sphingomonas lenta]|uniref:Class I SAM-dependent methyltransferase n=1 Tax=Sphingomonas lenta TaxID=1141887 RepID=A0A2A2SCT4_9SPHN|nr:hypothetical protein [Sphingomonas lenta]PAX07066.1 hypothetical protein CKY28_13530 [Sphingomonas lenta]